MKKVHPLHRFHCPALALLPLLPIILLPGCGSWHVRDSDPFFVDGVQQDDIPVPLYFQFDRDRSVAYTAYAAPGVGSFRSWTGYYYGDQQVGNLVPWYEEQMRIDGWAHRDTRVEQDRKRLTFQKGDETATIWLYRQFDHRLDRYTTVVQAEIHPTPAQQLSPEQLAGLTGREEASLAPSSFRGEATGEAPRVRRINHRQKSSETKAAPLVPSRSQPRPSSSRSPAAPPAAAPGNKPVVFEEVGAENNEETPAGEEFAPDDDRPN